jgi:DNA polymerase-1
MLDLLSLIGDSADNIPGVKGIGEKTACKLLSQYGSLDGIYENAEKITGAMGKKIIEGKDSAYLSKKLITLYSEVPIETSVEKFLINSLHVEAAAELLYKAGVPKIAEMYSAKQKSSAKTENNENDLFSSINIEGTDIPSTEIKKNAGNYRAITDVQELNEEIAKMLKIGCAAFDTETTGLESHTAKLAGFSFSCKKGEAFYVPILAPENEPCMNLEAAKKALSLIFENPNFMVITHNGKFDYEVLHSNNFFETDDLFSENKPKCTFIDTMIAAWLLNPERAGLVLV